MRQTKAPPAASLVVTPSRDPLRAIRQQRKITQDRLAALSGLSRGWVSFLDRNPEVLTKAAAAKLAAVLGVNPLELLP